MNIKCLLFKNYFVTLEVKLHRVKSIHNNLSMIQETSK